MIQFLLSKSKKYIGGFIMLICGRLFLPERQRLGNGNIQISFVSEQSSTQQKMGKKCSPSSANVILKFGKAWQRKCRDGAYIIFNITDYLIAEYMPSHLVLTIPRASWPGPSSGTLHLQSHAKVRLSKKTEAFMYICWPASMSSIATNDASATSTC